MGAHFNYGVPYKGSKNSLALDILAHLPAGEVFVDLFAGGCAVTHAAIESRRYKRFIANDLSPMPLKLFRGAIDGAASDRKRWLRWVTREEFLQERDTKSLADADPCVMLCWSFGNNTTSYIYGRHIEPWKRALWAARIDGDFSLLAAMGIITDTASRIWVRRNAKMCREKYLAWFAKNIGEVPDEAAETDGATLANLESERRLHRLNVLTGLECTMATETADYLSRCRQMERLNAIPPRVEALESKEYIDRLKQMEALGGGAEAVDDRLQSVERLERLDSIAGGSLSALTALQSASSLERLTELERAKKSGLLANLTFSTLDYREVVIPDGAVVYCDPPYADTDCHGYAGGDGGFDSVAFWDWVRTRPFPVFVSEYKAPEDFVCHYNRKHSARISATTNNAVNECVFVHRKWADAVAVATNKQMEFDFS